MGRAIDADKLKEHYAWRREDKDSVFAELADIVDQIIDAQPTIEFKAMVMDEVEE